MQYIAKRFSIVNNIMWNPWMLWEQYVNKNINMSNKRAMFAERNKRLRTGVKEPSLHLIDGHVTKLQGLASHCKAKTTFTFYFSIINA